MKKLLIPATFLLLFTALLPAFAGGKRYDAAELNRKVATPQEDGSVEIVFASLIETLYHCPGAKAKTTDDGLVLTILRASIKKNPAVDYPAKSETRDGRLVKVITIPPGVDKIYLRDGNKVFEIFSRAE